MNPLARECMIHERTKAKLKEALEEIERLLAEIERLKVLLDRVKDD